jgi:hypothetical protein
MRQLGRQGADEHVAHEERVPRIGRDEPHREPVGRIGAAEEILHVHLARVEVPPHVVMQPIEGRRVQPRILLPPDPVRRAGLLDHELVLGGAAGVRCGDGGEGAAIGELSFAPANRVLDEGWRGQVGVNPDGKEAVLDKRQTLARDCGRLGAHTLPVRVARKRTSGVGIGRGPGRKSRLVVPPGQPRGRAPRRGLRATAGAEG